jgi:sulfite exporter TauE/SafE
MQLILLIAGAILLLAVNAPWAATVGIILLVAFALITLVQLVALATVSRKIRREFRNLR